VFTLQNASDPDTKRVPPSTEKYKSGSRSYQKTTFTIFFLSYSSVAQHSPSCQKNWNHSKTFKWTTHNNDDKNEII